ncbi:MAG: 50S ribosomal protein L35 [candidate division WOR-3 bacterium]|nr:50S ribosomal protein L35 [candidate division WOR-3 bacterium]
MKLKTHKGLKKRIKITGKGKILHWRAGKSHLLAKKTKKRKRRLSLKKKFSKKDEKRIRKLIPGI